MTHTGSPNQVVFDSDPVEISYISTGKLIAKGVANHVSKAYEFSHFLPYSDPMPSQLPFEREGKFILPRPVTYDNVSINVSHSESEAEDKVESIYGIEDEVQSDLDPDRVHTPNPRPKWVQKFIEDSRNMTRESSDKAITQSQFQYESLALCHENPLLPKR